MIYWNHIQICRIYIDESVTWNYASCLKYIFFLLNIVKTKHLFFEVKSGKVEDMESSDIITFNSKTSQSETNALVQNRFCTMERTRVCSNCRLQRLCAVKCGTCEQIYYCSDACQDHDRKRHSNFCSLSLKDMLWEYISKVMFCKLLYVLMYQRRIQIFVVNVV